MMRILALLSLIFITPIVDQIVLRNNAFNTAYILLGWFAVWVICHWVFQKKWLLSISAVLFLSVIEDILYLLWGRIIGEIPWDAQWYCHDWIPLNCIVKGIPFSYLLSIIIGTILVVVYHRREIF